MAVPFTTFKVVCWNWGGFVLGSFISKERIVWSILMHYSSKWIVLGLNNDSFSQLFISWNNIYKIFFWIVSKMTYFLIPVNIFCLILWRKITPSVLEKALGGNSRSNFWFEICVWIEIIEIIWSQTIWYLLHGVGIILSFWKIDDRKLKSGQFIS